MTEFLSGVATPVPCEGTIVAEDDGIVAVPAAQLPDVANAAAKREATETDKRAKLGSGVLGLDLYNVRDTLAKAGLHYVD